MTTYLDQARAGVWDVPAGFLPACYFAGITAAGGIAVLLPPQPVDPQIADTVLDGLDALVLTGGRDVDPARYGQPPHPATDEPAGERDGWEFALLAAALRRRLPVLGICRGAQVLNIACGGTLHQHLPGHRAGNAVFTPLTAHTVAGTRLAGILGPSADVRCYHHQGIADVGEGLVISARDTDGPGGPGGVIEGIELPGEHFVLAVQWHPEESLDDLRLFTAVVDAARAYAGVRA